jgi:FixJ family two-component response regulator
MFRQITPAHELFVVDDDPAMRDALSVVFTRAGFRVTVFADGASFIAGVRDREPAAVLINLNLLDRSGLSVLGQIDMQHFPVPIFVISGESDVALVAEPVKNGAFDYVIMPIDAHAIIARVDDAIRIYAKRDGDENVTTYEFLGQELLTPREREVLAQIAAGVSKKGAGRRLGISPRTIEAHRARIMLKLGARNTAELVRIALCVNDPGKIVALAQLRPKRWRGREIQFGARIKELV